MLLQPSVQRADRLNLENFLQLPNIEESPAWEFVGQVAVQKPMPTLYHSRLQKRLIARIDGLGMDYEAFPELRCVLSTSSVVPDVAVVRADRIPAENGPLMGPPDWAIEILSPDQPSLTVIAKLKLCLREGTQLAWLMDPQEQLVLVMWPDRPLLLCEGEREIPGLAGLDLGLTAGRMFQEWLR
ncbi:Uma2 family endonuclease [Prochlorothrix hollandica]|uniref:Uma2 family endonuclease n=1 Tax=Prochlorothrix hollandica TaxID=1223 RepID=UPI0033413F6B